MLRYYQLSLSNWPLQDIVSLRGFIAQLYFLQTPPLLCNILYNITSYCSPPPNFEVFLRCFEVFFVFEGSDFGWVEVSEKKIVLDTEKGALLHIIVQYPPPRPPLLPTILRNIFSPRPPLLQQNIDNIL